MIEYKIKYWNSDSLLNIESNVFGCSVHGFSNRFEWINPDENAAASWSEKLSGVVLTGDFSTVLNSLQNLHFTPKACIAVVKNTNDIDFIFNPVKIILTQCKNTRKRGNSRRLYIFTSFLDNQYIFNDI